MSLLISDDYQPPYSGEPPIRPCIYCKCFGCYCFLRNMTASNDAIEASQQAARDAIDAAIAAIDRLIELSKCPGQ